jgi:hypothetical protein
MLRNKSSTTSLSWGIKDVENGSAGSEGAATAHALPQIRNAWSKQQLRHLRINPLRQTLGLNS